jgi:hypothetical protein
MAKIKKVNDQIFAFQNLKSLFAGVFSIKLWDEREMIGTCASWDL